jgi:hypothetical protein
MQTKLQGITNVDFDIIGHHIFDICQKLETSESIMVQYISGTLCILGPFSK